MDLNFNNMDDEEFRKEFMKFLTTYQSSIKNLMDRNKGNDYFINPFNMDEDMIKKIFNNIQNDFNTGENEMGDFRNINFSRGNFDMYPKFKSHDFGGEQKEMDTLQLLDMKMKNAIINENYEDAAKIRDLIKSLKED